MDNQSQINWKIRWKNKVWVAGFFAQTILVLQGILFALEGMHVIDMDMEQIDGWAKSLMTVVDLVLAYLSYLGIVIDPTVEGVGDSRIALRREEPLPESKKNSITYK